MMGMKNFPVPVEGQKVVSATRMAEMEARAILEGDATSNEYMEKAAQGIFEVAIRYIQEKNLKYEVILVCGKGNNGADAYSVGELLLENDIKVSAYQLFPLETASQLCREHAESFKDKGGEIYEMNKISEFLLPPGVFVLDGMLGTGFRGRVEGLMKEVIQKLNRSPNPILAVDIPSGVIGDSGIVEGEAVNADLTVYVGLLKIGHLYNQGFEYAGELHAVDFGMSEKYISEIESFGSIVNLEIVVKNLPFRKRTVNKYSVGQVLLIAGSPGMPGAAILAAKAALRSGAGMVRLCHPPDMEYELFGCPPEVVRHSYTVDHMEKIFQELSRTNAILIGSGLGRSNDVPKILKRVYQEATCPLVIDGDALFFFEGGTRPAILTPHKGELKKLLKVSEEISDLELIRLAEEFAKIHKVVIVFKGAPTTVIAPNQPKVIIPYGNKGMASGGMGDALAGIITSLLAQGKELREAAILGATIHALAGDKAKETHSQYAMIASDLIESLPLIFLQSSD
jgi:NAD(P)H-hydrate epimerase